MKVGFIGLGNMGLPMAENLFHAGYDVIGFDLKKNIKSKFPVVSKLKDVILDKQVVFTMLPSGSEVTDVYQQIVASCSPGTIMVDCSTIDIHSAYSAGRLAKKSELFTLDAPVSGGVIGDEQGTLTFMVGGDWEGFEALKPLFDVMGKKAVYCGLSGTGEAANICNNMRNYNF